MRNSKVINLSDFLELAREIKEKSYVELEEDITDLAKLCNYRDQQKEELIELFDSLNDDRTEDKTTRAEAEKLIRAFYRVEVASKELTEHQNYVQDLEKSLEDNVKFLKMIKTLDNK